MKFDGCSWVVSSICGTVVNDVGSFGSCWAFVVTFFVSHYMVALVEVKYNG